MTRHGKISEHRSELLKIVGRGIIRRRGLDAFGVLAAYAIAGVGYGQAQTLPTLPECVQPGQTVTLDLSTGTTNGNPNADGTQDPKWLLFSTPPGTGLTSLPASPYSTSYGGWAPPGPATWIQPWSGPAANQTAPNGPYAYEVDFNIPPPLSQYSNITLSGQCRADDLATVLLANGPTQNCGPFIGPSSANQPLNFSFSSSSGAIFWPGGMAFQANVQNTGLGTTGLMISATLSAVCATGTLKICKAAGPGITVSTPFSFTANGTQVSVPAGPAPGGTCVVVNPGFLVGTPVHIAETAMSSNIAVSNIVVAVDPPGSVGNINPANGTADFTIGSGVTEVTYTDYNRPGYLEICKSGYGSGNFTVDPGGLNLGPFIVAAGSCSPAIQVNAGQVTIQEAPNSSLVMNGCATIPSGRLVLCDYTNKKATVKVVPGGVSTQTIVTINNVRRRS
jgi:hypothetical protein